MGLNLAVILVTAPVWIAAIVVYLVPLPSNLRYMFWTVLFFLAIALALHAFYYLYWKRNQR